MNDLKFEELVNLYFDREINSADLESLRQEIAKNLERRNKFKARYQLHKATCFALSSKGLEKSDFQDDATQKAGQRKYPPSLLAGLGMAACFLVVFTISASVLKKSIEDPEIRTAQIPDGFDKTEFARNKEASEPNHSSLSSQLRLAGLTPDIVPEDRQISSVDAEALLQREAYRQSVIKQLDLYQRYSAVPEPRIIESFDQSHEALSDNHWPTNFKSSLASF